MSPAKKITKSDPIALLKSDHRKVEALFKSFENAKSKSVKQRLAHDICLELSVHTTIEEEIFYPGVKASVEHDLYDEAYVEHDGAKVLIAEILVGTPDDEFFDAKVKVLSEMIKHHVKEEEQRGGYFAQAKRDGEVDLSALASEMVARKKLLVAQMKSAGVPPPATRSMKGAAVGRSTPVE
jgi:hemerythrin superfamily protein